MSEDQPSEHSESSPSSSHVGYDIGMILYNGSLDEEDESSEVVVAESSSSSSIDEHGSNITSSSNDNSGSPRARMHTYLPGTTYEIYPVELLQQKTQTTHDCKGSTEWLHSKLETDITQVPILQLDGVVLFPNNTLPLRITDASFCRYLKEQIEAAKLESVHWDDNNTESNFGNKRQVRIGIVTRLRHRRRRQHLQRMMHATEENGEEREERSDQARPINRRMGRWNMARIRRNRIPTRYEDDGEIADLDQTSDGNGSHNDALEGDEDENRSGNLHTGRQLPPEQRSINYGRNISNDRIKGRIGTFATIISVNEENDEGSNELDDGDNSQHLIITTMSTGRFKVDSPANNNSHNSDDDDFVWRIYNVKEIDDTPISIPIKRKRLCKGSISEDNKDESDVILHRRNDQILDVSRRSQLPIFALKMIWPSYLVSSTISEIKTNPLYQGVKKIIPDARLQFSGNFSFWLCANLAFSQNEQLYLLEIDTEVERLKLILQMMHKRIQYIRCKQCKSNIALMTEVFSLEMAEGTSGNYVNEYGVVHQTTTLKTSLEGAIVCVGGPETRDSWFDGYSWTISYCATCFNHLGWKFIRTRNDLEPRNFWGLSGSQII